MKRYEIDYDRFIKYLYKGCLRTFQLPRMKCGRRRLFKVIFFVGALGLGLALWCVGNLGYFRVPLSQPYDPEGHLSLKLHSCDVRLRQG